MCMVATAMVTTTPHFVLALAKSSDSNNNNTKDWNFYLANSHNLTALNDTGTLKVAANPYCLSVVGNVALLLAAGVVVFVVVFVDVGGIPHIFNSVELTKLSFGLLGLHIAAFCYGVNDDGDDDCSVLLLDYYKQYQSFQIPLLM